jgi:hypothetical protein
MQPATAAHVLKWALPCVMLVMAGCAQPSQPPLDVTHVHGVAYDAANDAVYLASHHGLARGQREGSNWAWEFVGDRYDYMGFTKDTVRSGAFYSSGHPDDPRAYGACTWVCAVPRTVEKPGSSAV